MRILPLSEVVVLAESGPCICPVGCVLSLLTADCSCQKKKVEKLLMQSRD